MSGAESLHQVLEKIAKEHDYDDYKVNISLVHTEGANYTSQLFNITLSGPKKQDLTLFAKVASLSENFRSMSSVRVFDTEIIFYTKIMAKYREFEERFNFPRAERLVVPKYYGGSTEYMKETIVLEDLTAQGYQPFDRFKCYDWRYASKCISTLARIHAMSIRYKWENTAEFEDLAEMFESKIPVDHMKDMMVKMVTKIIGTTEEKYRERLVNFLQKHMSDEYMLKFCNPDKKMVLNHRDFKPNNTLHKTNEKGELEVVVIDYQVIHRGNPVSDLLYFLVTGSDEVFREKHMDQYFNHYYEEFSKTLRRLEIDPEDVYTRKDFDADVKRMLPMGIMIAVISLPFVTVEVKDVPNLEDGLDFNAFDMELSEQFRKRFNGLVKDYAELGIL